MTAGSIVFYNATHIRNRLQGFASHVAFRILAHSNYGHVGIARGNGLVYSAIDGVGVTGSEPEDSPDGVWAYPGSFPALAAFIDARLGEPYSMLGTLLTNPIYNLSGGRIRLYGQLHWNCATLVGSAILSDPSCPPFIREKLAPIHLGAMTPQDLWDALAAPRA